MKISPFIIINLLIILGVTPSIMINAYAVPSSVPSSVSNSAQNSAQNSVTKNENLDSERNSIASSNTHFNNNSHKVSLNDVSSGTLLFKQSTSKQYFQAPQLKTEVEIEINGLVANVKVKQKFTNTSNDWQHGVYAYPLPDNSAINQLKMRVGERVIIGEVQEKKRALKTFNNAKKSGRKAALIEQHRPNLFTTSIANIPPNETIEVELNYFQQVDYHDEEGRGEFSLHFPMAITPRYQPANTHLSRTSYVDNSLPNLSFQSQAQTQAQLIDLTVNLFAGAELQQVNSINHSLISSQQGHGHYALKLTNQPMDKDFKLIWQYNAQALPQVLNFQQAYQGKKYGLLMVLPGLPSLNENTIKPLRELTFILDTSGSMAGASLAQAKEAFKYALTSLNERDSFQLISFNSYPTKHFKAPVLASEANKKQAWRIVSKLQSTGGTEIKSALDLALINQDNHNEKLQQIVFLTDGAVGNEAEIFAELTKKIGNKRLFTVGLGTAPNRYFMKKSAEIGRGSYEFISNHSELVKQMDRLFTKLSQPVLTDLKMTLNDPNGFITVKGIAISNLQTTPDPIPDIYAGEPLFLSYQLSGLKSKGLQSKGQQSDSLLSGIYQGKTWSVNIENYQQADAESNAIGRQTLVAKSTVKPTAKSEATPSSEKSIPPLATLWARRKIADHYRQLMLFKDTEAKNNIIELALKYHLVTPFTSLVAVEKEVSRPTISNQKGQATHTKQLKNALPSGQKLPSTALNWQWQFNSAICLLLMSVISLMLLPIREKNSSKNLRREPNAER